MQSDAPTRAEAEQVEERASKDVEPAAPEPAAEEIIEEVPAPEPVEQVPPSPPRRGWWQRR
jgi:hypothetical protein